MRLNFKKIRIAISLVSLMAFSFCFAEDLPQSHIQTLAASCAACHGSAGNPVENIKNPNIKNLSFKNLSAENPAQAFQLAGLKAENFIKQMQDFKSGVRVSTVMHHHAKGLTMQEIEQLALFFSSQKAKVVQALPTQVYVSPRDADDLAK